MTLWTKDRHVLAYTRVGGGGDIDENGATKNNEYD